MSTIRLERLENPNTSNGGIDIDSSGNIGINTASFSTVSGISGAKLQSIGGVIVGNDGAASNGSGWLAFDSACNAPTSAKPVIYHRQGVGLGIRSDYQISFEIGSSDAVKIDEQRRLLVGTTTGTGNNLLQVKGSTLGAGYPGGAFFNIGLNVASVDSNYELGRIDFGNQEGYLGASIVAAADLDWNASDYPSRMMFFTTADGASSPTERLRIDANGRLTQATDTYNFTTVDAANMSISSTGNIRRSTSSLRYKTDVETMEDVYADNILNARPVWYRSACEDDNPSYGYWGFIAEEISQIDPRLCFYSQNENGDQQVDGVAYDRFVPHLLNLIKRQKEQIETLEAKVAALEGNEPLPADE